MRPDALDLLLGCFHLSASIPNVWIRPLFPRLFSPLLKAGPISSALPSPRGSTSDGAATGYLPFTAQGCGRETQGDPKGKQKESNGG